MPLLVLIGVSDSIVAEEVVDFGDVINVSVSALRLVVLVRSKDVISVVGVFGLAPPSSAVMV